MMTHSSFIPRRLAAAALFVLAPVLGAQTPDTATAGPRTAMDSAFARARQLVIAGQTVAGRQIADSILAVTPVSSPAYGNALFGRAQLAPTAADAERDYQRIIVEYPLSTHTGDALLELAQLERSQGKRAAAIVHLQRFLRENPGGAKRARTGFWLAQLLFEQNDDPHACAALDSAKTAVAPSDIELQNQMNFYSTRCDAAAARVTADSTARADSVRADSIARAKATRRAPTHPAVSAKPSTKPAPPAAAPSGPDDRGGYSVQVAAFGIADDARKVVDRLHGRGIEARVDGDRKPFRVRIGHYKTKAEAAKALVAFKKIGLDGFVTDAGGR